VSDLKQKPFDIDKRLVWEAYRKVAANKGAAGVDGQSIAEFEEDLKGNLYKLWNRLSSGTYFPPPVRGVEIPKKAGGTRGLIHCSLLYLAKKNRPETAASMLSNLSIGQR
jgi:RNA-directed DNA polymerase